MWEWTFDEEFASPFFGGGQVLGCGRRSREFRSGWHKNWYNCHNLWICSMSSSFVSFSFDLVAVIDIACVDGNPNLMYKFVNLPRWLHWMVAKSLNRQIVQDFPMFPISYPIRIPVFLTGTKMPSLTSHLTKARRFGRGRWVLDTRFQHDVAPCDVSRNCG